MQTQTMNLIYTLMCDDVRIEMGNKISIMGIFQNIMVEKLPVSLIKFAVINHWRGEGSHETEVRILSPDRSNLLVTSHPTPIDLAPGAARRVTIGLHADQARRLRRKLRCDVELLRGRYVAGRCFGGRQS